jgi:hypothetical protein
MMEKRMVRPTRFELVASCSGGKRSIQLSYGRTQKAQISVSKLHRFAKMKSVRNSMPWDILILSLKRGIILLHPMG